LRFLGLSKLHTENCFGFATKYFISEGYQAGRSFYFIPRGSYLLVKTKLFSHVRFIPICIDKVTDLKSVDCWSIGKYLYRETIINFFEFYSSFDKFAFSFEEIDNCSFDDELFIQSWKENRSHIARKEACLQKLKEEMELVIVWYLLKSVIIICIRHLIQNYLNWWRRILWVFNGMEKDWFIEKELKRLDNSFNESGDNSVLKVILTIKKNIFFGNSLFRFIKRIFLIKRSPLYYNGVSLVIYTDPIVES
jgi:hypothetical protein